MSRAYSQTYIAPRAPFVCLVVLLVAAGLAGLVVLNTEVNGNAFQLHDQAQQKKQLDVREAQLSRDVANLGTPSQLETEARRLGLVPTGAPAFVDLSTGRITGTPIPAGGGQGR